jgi:hypothetical protein
VRELDGQKYQQISISTPDLRVLKDVADLFKEWEIHVVHDPPPMMASGVAPGGPPCWGISMKRGME